MKIYCDPHAISDAPTVCALGCFDGVHLGHAAIISEAKTVAQKSELLTAVWSFNEPPKNYFCSEKVKLLTAAEEKYSLMSALGVDLLVAADFDESVATLSAENFFKDILVDRLKARHIVCGFNYRFGRGGIGDVEMLASLCRKHGLSLSVVPPVALGGTTVSSSEIRSALERGDIERANLLLGRPYSLCAKVIDGQHLGRSLGFPTVNQVFDPRKQLPPYGVYASRVCIGGALRYGITNVGMRPTVGGTLLCAETNIFDFDGDLYGKTLTVELISFIRPEKKFDSVDSLSAQVHADIARAKEIFKFK